ncbi:MAG: Heparin-sulfate lyase precursor [Syntrophorhabdus sp. PtaU1.Bin058]|nr:MAG: Heparin-sulfate lyase precursor [Syntrophorhabdus sp. PtaU1.Bin058]
MLPGRNIKAYIARIRNASLPEMTYRVSRAITVRRMRANLKSRKKVPHIPPLDEIKTHDLHMPSFVMEVDGSVVEDIFSGRVFTLNGNRDAMYQFGAAWRRTYFADIRPAPESPDIRMVWEPARLQHLTILMAYVHQRPRSPGINIVKSFVRERLLAWIRHNPFLSGPHYMSPMECGLRMPVFFYALAVLDNLPPAGRREILKALYLHAWWVSRNLSLYSSLGNHTICECAGLIFAGTVFRRTAEGQMWVKKGARLMEEELQRQVLEDGGPLEQSLAYHRFVLDLFWLAADFLEKNSSEDCKGWKQRLGRAEAFLDAFRDGQGYMPSIGDSDGGYAVAPGIAPMRTAGADRYSNKVATFPDAGYTLFRFPGEGLLSLDHGPLGMPPLYNHGHADALSVTFSLKGVPFLIDSGTYRYNGEPQWRRYFKGTRAHNTVSIDGRDQAEQETGFIWKYPYSTRIIRNETGNSFLFIEAEHDGYKRLEQPVAHRRAVFRVDDFTFLVRDRFSGQGLHTYELNWHLHPRAEVKNDAGWWRIENGKVVIFLRLMGVGDFDLLCGGMNPIKGWYSPQYGIREACPVLTRSVEGEPEETEFITMICAGQRIEEEKFERAICRMRTSD